LCFQNQRETDGSASNKLVKVKKQYKDVDDYINTYEPLIFEEAKAQIIRGKEEDNGIFFFIPFCIF
jgi:senataxin